MARRQPIAPLNQSATQVAKNAKAETERKKASKAALKAAKAEATQPEPVSTQPAPVAKIDHKAQDAANALATAKADAEATGVSLDKMLEEMGIDTNGYPIEAKTGYAGPMIALKVARKSYVKAANGVLCNGSPLALLCGQYSRDVVVKALVKALKLEGNPYTHLNPGQQSMNLRNKARHAISNGFLSLGEIEAELKAEAVIAGSKAAQAAK